MKCNHTRNETNLENKTGKVNNRKKEQPRKIKSNKNNN